MPKGGIIFCTEIARTAMVYIICPWHSWIARETPTLEAAGSNPVGQARKTDKPTLVVRKDSFARIRYIS